MIISGTLLENNTELATKLSEIELSERRTYQIDSNGYSKSILYIFMLNLTLVDLRYRLRQYIIQQENECMINFLNRIKYS